MKLGRPLMGIVFALVAGAAIYLGLPVGGRGAAGMARAGTPKPAIMVAGVAVTDRVLARGLNYLLTVQQPNGAWLDQVGPATTALVVKAFLQAGIPASSPAIVHALHYIKSTHQPDGGFYVHNMLQNYNTSIVLSTLAILPGKDWKKQIHEAQHYLISLQRVAPMKDANGQPITPDNSWYGGVGYGAGRPDLSNTTFFISALHDSGIPSSSPVIQRALVFVTRCQENSETNAQPFAKGLSNGGFIYTAANGGESQAGDRDNLKGGATLSAYGTMTYAGLKSMVYAGLTKTDPRVKAALKWIRANWTLSFNPGTGHSKMGLFYYYLMFARSLAALGTPEITDANGIRHNWRREIHEKLAALQRKNGSWKNIWSKRWLEFNPVLVTSYSCLVLDAADGNPPTGAK